MYDRAVTFRALAVLIALLGLSCGPAGRPLFPRASNRSLAPFLRAVQGDDGTLIQWQAIRVLAEVDDEEGRACFASLTSHANPQVRSLAVRRMGEDPGARYRAEVVAALRDPDLSTRIAALTSQIGQGGEDALATARSLVQACLDDRVPCALDPSLLVLLTADAPDVHRLLQAARAHYCHTSLGAPLRTDACALIEMLRLMAGDATDAADLLAAWSELSETERRVILADGRYRPIPSVCALARSALADASPELRMGGCRVLARCMGDETNQAALRAVAQRDRDDLVRLAAARALPEDDAAGTAALVDLLERPERLNTNDAMAAATLLAHRGHVGAWASMERLVTARARDWWPASSLLIDQYPYVAMLAEFTDPRADALLRRLRANPSVEGLVATLVLVRRGDLQVPSYFDDALDGDLGLEAQLLAVLIDRERRPRRASVTVPGEHVDRHRPTVAPTRVVNSSSRFVSALRIEPTAPVREDGLSSARGRRRKEARLVAALGVALGATRRAGRTGRARRSGGSPGSPAIRRCTGSGARNRRSACRRTRSAH